VVTAVQDWRKVATQVGMSKLEADKFESAFEHEELARALSSVG
jgi:hypothetical protein